MAEWLKAAVLKTVSGVTRSGVRIPLPPPRNFASKRCIVGRLDSPLIKTINAKPGNKTSGRHHS